MSPSWPAITYVFNLSNRLITLTFVMNYVGMFLSFGISILHLSVWVCCICNIDCLAQDCSISSANALEILQSCTKVWLLRITCVHSQIQAIIGDITVINGPQWKWSYMMTAWHRKAVPLRGESTSQRDSLHKVPATQALMLDSMLVKNTL